MKEPGEGARFSKLKLIFRSQIPLDKLCHHRVHMIGLRGVDHAVALRGVERQVKLLAVNRVTDRTRPKCPSR
jgi:hypothetical protein